MEFDPLADLFPLIDGPDFDQLCADIKAHGLLDSIKTHAGRIVDGRNRYRACLKVGVTPRFEAWNGQGSLVEYVLSLNLHRRHLTASQRAVAVAKALPLLEEEARKRQEATRAKPGAKVGAIVPPPTKQGEKGRATEKAAQVGHVSRRTVQAAKRVLQKGSQETIKAVETGKISVSKAARLSDLTAEEQFKAICEEEANVLANGRQQDVQAKRQAAMNALRRALKKWQALVGGEPVVRHLTAAVAQAEKILGRA